MKNHWKKILLAAVVLVAGMFYFTQSDAVAEEGVMRGELLTPFKVVSLEGKEISIDSQKKKMVINFWATWCPPCQEEMPEFEEFIKRNPEVPVYLVSIEEDEKTIRSFLKQRKLNLEPVIDPRGKASDLYQVSAIPTTLVVDENGVIIFRKVGPITVSELERVIKK